MRGVADESKRTAVDEDEGTQGRDAGPRPPLPPMPEPVFLRTLFGGSRLICFCLVPILVFTGASFLWTVPDWRSWRAGWFVALALVCFLLALALLGPRRFGWAARIVTGMVFLACCGYLADSVFWPAAGPHGGDELAGSVMAMLMFGLPSLWFTLRGSRNVPAGAG